MLWLGGSFEKEKKLFQGKRLTKDMARKTKRSILWIPRKNQSKQKYLGVHLVAEFWFGKVIENPENLEKILVRAARKAKNIPLKVVIHKFTPRGITGVVLLSESHLTLHSWPEKNYLAIDIFTCGQKTSPEKALVYLKKIFKPKVVEIKKIKRGIIS